MDRLALKRFALRFSGWLTEAISEKTGDSRKTAYFERLWFMRLTALRFMEVSGFLPDGMPLFSDAQSPGTLRRNILSLCRKYGRNAALAPLFREDASAFLPVIPADDAPEGFCHVLDENLLAGHPEILGWLYQYRNAEERENAIRAMRCHGKIRPEQIPAATQMFTPDWITRYLTENAIGALRPHAGTWAHFIPSADQPDTAQSVLRKMQESRDRHSLEELTVIDPCMGTGHILTSVFDVLMDCYRQEGYAPAKAAVCILRKNLYGLDIDAAAAALAAFVLLMKARCYDPDILARSVRLHLCHFGEAGEGAVFGSLLRPDMPEMPESPILRRMLDRRYDAVITNPPYMGSSCMDQQLSGFVRKYYPDSKSDLFAAFMERCAGLTARNGCFAMITQHSWMFLSSYEKLRRKMRKFTLRNMVHLGAKAFSQTEVGTIVQTTAFVSMGRFVPDYRTTYLRLTEDENKETAFFDENKRYICDISQFSDVVGNPLCYWADARMLEALRSPKLSSLCRICQGMTTSDNKRFVRRWFEVPREAIAFGCRDAQEAMATGKRWFPYNKGGRFRRWYGNQTHVVDFADNGAEMRAFHAKLNEAHSGGRIKNEAMYFREAVTWPFISESTRFGVRYQPQGALFDVSGSSLFPEREQMLWLMGFLSSKAALEMLKIYNPTMNYQVENISALPVIYDPSQKEAVESLVQENIAISRAEWDSYEDSWDFTVHPLVRQDVSRLADAWELWNQQCIARKAKMLENERRLNEIFLRVYGLEELFSPEPADSDITLRDADVGQDLRRLVNFIIGCYFGRFHVETVEIPVLAENFLPLAEAADCVKEFLRLVYGEETLAENLRYLAENLGYGDDPEEGLRQYFAKEYYEDHCRIFHRRPICWMAESGRRRAFAGLMYLHRMASGQMQLLARHAEETENRIRSQLAMQEDMREIQLLQGKLAEIQRYRSILAPYAAEDRLPDPDAAVQQNYAAFRPLLGRIR